MEEELFRARKLLLTKVQDKETLNILLVMSGKEESVGTMKVRKELME